MTMKEKNEIGTALVGRICGITMHGRVYKVCRGVYQVQHPVRPGDASYCGTKKEVERVCGKISRL